MNAVTAHCLIKNEENFVEYAIRSVIDFVDKILVFDTGSTDKTADIIMNLVREYPNKIIFEEKGECDKKRHTQLRQEMVDRTKTGWFMILDGDEVWTKRAMKEAVKIINESNEAECLVVPFYLCVGDIFYRYYKEGGINILGKVGFIYPRFIKIINGVHWRGDYNQDSLFFNDGRPVAQPGSTVFLENKYWHLTHLVRSAKDYDDYSSGGNRGRKRRLTYFVIGKKIEENIPEIFLGGNNLKMGWAESIINFFRLAVNIKNNKIKND